MTANISTAKRILYVHNSADIYGASRCLARLVAALDHDRFEPLVMLPEGGPLKQRLEELGIRVIVEPSLAIISRYESLAKTLLLRVPLSTIRLYRRIRQESVQFVHTNSSVIISSAFAACLARRPHFWHVRESFEEFKGWRWKAYRALMLFLSRRIVCVSSAIAAQFNGSRKALVIHDGFPLEEFEIDREKLRREFRQHFDIEPDILVIGCVGRIKLHRKGQEYLIRAAHLLKQRGLSAKYLIVGSPYRGNEGHLEELRRLVGEFELETAVHFTGELSDPKPAYAAMDIFVLPSAQPEPFGGVVMEAMAMALPVIATDIGGSTDQVRDGVTGFLIPPGDAEALADKITQLAAASSLRKQMAEAGRERIRTEFNLQSMIQCIETMYESTLQ